LNAEIVTIGTELLLGEIVDTNSAWIAQRLTTIGLNLFYTTTVGDNLERIVETLRHSLERSEVVITTGGLGPTVDDKTREAVALATGRDLVLDPDLEQEIAAFFARRGHTMTDNNRRQALLPQGALVIHNPVGTAPAFAVEQGGRMIVCLPGVPHEMRYLMEHEVIPLLRGRFGLHDIIYSRVLKTCGIGESSIDSRIGDLMTLSNPTVGTRAHPGQTDVVITAKAKSAEAAQALIAPIEAAIRERLGERVFGVDGETLGEITARLLAQRSLSLGVIETTTRGQLSDHLMAAAGDVRVLAGVIVSQSPAALARLLGNPELGEMAFPSQEAADALAVAVRRRLGCDLGLAQVGLPDLGQDDGPPVYLALASGQGLVQGAPRRWRSGTAARGWLVHVALDLVRRHLLGAVAEAS